MRYLAALAAAAALAVPTAASAAQPCWKTVLADWTADGRIDGGYPVACLQRALEALPVDGPPPQALVDEIHARLAGDTLRAAPPAQAGDGGVPAIVWVATAGAVVLVGGAVVAHRRG